MASPPLINYVVSFVLVGLAWGLTTPFIRRAARSHSPPPHPLLDSPAVRASPVRARLLSAFFAVADLVRNPRYAVPLLLNLTGSVWFFLLIGQAGAFCPLFRALAMLTGTLIPCRTEPDGAHRQYACLSLHHPW